MRKSNQSLCIFADFLRAGGENTQGLIRDWLRGPESDRLRELMGLPGKPFPTLPPYFSDAVEKYGEVRPDLTEGRFAI